MTNRLIAGIAVACALLPVVSARAADSPAAVQAREAVLVAYGAIVAAQYRQFAKLTAAGVPVDAAAEAVARACEHLKAVDIVRHLLSTGRSIEFAQVGMAAGAIADSVCSKGLKELNT